MRVPLTQVKQPCPRSIDRMGHDLPLGLNTCLGAGFDDDKGLRPRVVICQRDVNDRLVAVGCHLG